MLYCVTLNPRDIEIMTQLLRKVYDNQQSDSLSTNLRRKRVALFLSLLASIPRPLKILDVGGVEMFWENVGFFGELKGDIEITLINRGQLQVTHHQNVKSLIGDARNMAQFEDNQFDVVFSNSVIEHVGDFNDQLKMANEIKRVGQRYFLQTPNLYFPIEPHFLVPLFQFFPLWLKVWLISHFDLGWYKKATDKQKAIEIANSVKLLSKQDVTKLFPGANMVEEKFLGLTKSFIVYDGWEIT